MARARRISEDSVADWQPGIGHNSNYAPPEELAAELAALRAAEAALEDSIERERRLKEAVEQRIAEFAHDVKNPLNAMIAYSEVIKDELMGPIESEVYKEYVGILHTSALRLLELCQSILGKAPSEALDREAVPQEEDFQDVDMGRMIDEVATLYAEQARQRGIALETKVAPDFPLIHAVPQHLYRAMTNLLSNAVKFTPQGGKVIVDAHLDESEDAVVVVVRDSGKGIPTDQILRIQQAYETTVSSRGDKGTGLGLPIVSKLMAQLGGSMAITSRESAGTRVTLRFPRSMTRPVSRPSFISNRLPRASPKPAMAATRSVKKLNPPDIRTV